MNSHIKIRMQETSGQKLHYFTGAAVKMDHFQPALDPRKQELLEARFLGARVSSKHKHLCTFELLGGGKFMFFCILRI